MRRLLPLPKTALAWGVVAFLAAEGRTRTVQGVMALRRGAGHPIDVVRGWSCGTHPWCGACRARSDRPGLRPDAGGVRTRTDRRAHHPSEAVGRDRVARRPGESAAP